MSLAYSIYEAKTHLSRLLKTVKEGREVVISERGKPIAKVVPLKRGESFEERLSYLRSVGAILPAKKGVIPKGVRRPGGLRRFLRDRE